MIEVEPRDYVNGAIVATKVAHHIAERTGVMDRVMPYGPRDQFRETSTWRERLYHATTGLVGPSALNLIANGSMMLVENVQSVSYSESFESFFENWATLLGGVFMVGMSVLNERSRSRNVWDQRRSFDHTRHLATFTGASLSAGLNYFFKF